MGSFYLWPQSTGFTRAGLAASAATVWAGLLVLLWRRPLWRYLHITLSIAALGFLAIPGASKIDPEVLRQDYLTALQRYRDVKYVWGGESHRGIDCSGLIRRGMIDALAWRGVRDFQPSLVRQALDLWWHDCSADALAREHRQYTTAILKTPSLDALDYTKIAPGDLAITSSGIHILAYLGERTWIEADPMEHRVLTVQAPAPANVWFQSPMQIVRWHVLGYH